MEFKVDFLDESLIPIIEPLIEENHAVSGQFDELDLNWDMYLHNAKNIVVIRLQDDNDICVGVLIFVIGYYPHNKEQVFADQLTFFVQYEHRLHVKKMMDLSEGILESYGCEFVIQSARYGSKFCKTLVKEDYEPLDVKYMKRLT